MTSPLHNSSARWANVHLDRETEHKAALETLVLLNAITDQAKKAVKNHEEKSLDWQFSFARFIPAHIDFILATLGTGEVRINIDNGRVKIEETAIPALWHVQENGEHRLELALIPPIVQNAIEQIPLEFTVFPSTSDEVFAAPSILMQLQASLEKTDIDTISHDPAQMIELTRQPLASADREYLKKVLGVGTIEIWLSGFANANIRSTNIRGIWSSHLLNNAGKELLDSYIVACIPPEVPVAPEELEDTIRISSETIHWIENDIQQGRLG